jgi:hypothetical protein
VTSAGVTAGRFQSDQPQARRICGLTAYAPYVGE